MNKFLKITSTITLLIFLRVSMALAADQVYFYYTDPAGTPLAMSDATGAVVWRADYLPFGEETIGASTVQNNKMFVGKEKDNETGLHYFGARYMDSAAGRFVSPDPIGAVEPGTGEINQLILHDPQRLNYYAYGLNNPYKYVDVDGKQAILAPLIWGAIGLAGAGLIMAARDHLIHNEQQQGESSKPQSNNDNKTSDKGKRRKNWISEKGEPGTVEWNNPETTGNRYGEDGWVEKEYNKGHQGDKTPAVEKDGHVHDWKPNPHHPEGRPTRQPGRTPSAEDKIDFNK